MKISRVFILTDFLFYTIYNVTFPVFFLFFTKASWMCIIIVQRIVSTGPGSKLPSP